MLLTTAAPVFLAVLALALAQPPILSKILAIVLPIILPDLLSEPVFATALWAALPLLPDALSASCPLSPFLEVALWASASLIESKASLLDTFTTTAPTNLSGALLVTPIPNAPLESATPAGGLRGLELIPIPFLNILSCSPKTSTPSCCKAGAISIPRPASSVLVRVVTFAPRGPVLPAFSAGCKGNAFSAPLPSLSASP
ncbi:MAG: hypothetical protein BWY16_00221 [Candidatus Omnitrophica bacterium ADurb.Bin205]|nr:MAG: hypothetical protein BWY16_00221 [Candidatus Omnitrophica bacterium ADurb.Bin205]